MKSFLVDVPVRVNIWIRPECQRKQFEVIKQARPSILFLVSDGGRTESEWSAIYQNRKIFDEEIDWECTVYKLYEETNNGLYSMGKKGAELIWSKVDRCIFLEDDQLPSISFFRYCAELLEYYKDDLRVECICGMNHLEKCEDVSSDYFFSRQGSIWGTAIWKRTVENRTFEYSKDPYIMKLLKQRTKRNPIAWKKICAYAKNEYYEGHRAGGEFFHEFAMYGYNQLQIIPKVNMIRNIGIGDNSIHFRDDVPDSIKKLFEMNIYEMEFPIKHTKYVIPDVEYEIKRNKIMCYNDKFGRTKRFLKRICRLEFSYIFKRIKSEFENRRNIELER